jgi:hypothetical protein
MTMPAPVVILVGMAVPVQIPRAVVDQRIVVVLMLVGNGIIMRRAGQVLVWVCVFESPVAVRVGMT